jgi:hypothetical protein
MAAMALIAVKVAIRRNESFMATPMWMNKKVEGTGLLTCGRPTPGNR